MELNVTNSEFSTQLSNVSSLILERVCGEVSSVEAKDSSGGNYNGQGKGFPTGRLHEVISLRLHQSELVGGIRERF